MTHLDEEKKVDAVVEHIEASPQLDTEHATSKYRANTQLDDAARLLQEAGGHVEYSPEESKRILRRIDLYVCLPMCITYWM